MRDDSTGPDAGPPPVKGALRPIRRLANRRLSAANRSAGRSMWTADLGDRPLTVADLDVHEAPASAPVAQALGLAVGEPVVVRDRLYVVEGEPVQLATSYLPAALVRDSAIARPDTGPGGVCARLAELGLRPVRFTEELRVRPPSRTEATRLRPGPSAPVLEICRTAFTDEGRAVEWTRMVLDPAVFVLEYQLTDA
ncbi:UTRA domain-containing protein [Streptomyces sp. NPDC005805]|uniref:GntR family transcriptional regulator n=1 Tax=Streptomyces sp. NPDC005805 TaxID=3157068 RepID=UPI0033C3C08F